MRQRTLQEIEDSYKNKGYSEIKLRDALHKDRQWLAMVRKRKQKLTKTFPLTEAEKKKYVMSTDEDYMILEKIKRLKKMKVSKDDKEVLALIRSQLQHDWRQTLIRHLNKMLKRKAQRR